MALAFVPQHEVEALFDECVSHLDNDQKQTLTGFISYFCATWVSGLFQIKLWNKFGQDYLHRTNNRVESWHSTLKQKLPTHPNVFVLVKALQQIECGTQLTIVKADVGESPPLRRAKSVKLDEKLKHAYDKHLIGEINSAELLRQTRHCVRKYQ